MMSSSAAPSTSPSRPAPPARHLRGQSLVEFALVLPVMLVLLLVGLDFGRVFLGYINVQNMARIAANFAANNPEAWGVFPDSAIQARYQNQVIADASATNCRLPVSSGEPVVPAPQFVDRTGDGVATGLGDDAKVQITCTFSLITPVISDIVGGKLNVTAESDFPVKTGLSAVGSAGGPGSPVVPAAAFTGDDVVSERSAPYPVLTDVTTFTVEFRDTSGGSPTSWHWDFGDGHTSSARDPLGHAFQCAGSEPCEFHVSMIATNPNGSSTAHMDVTVLPATAVDFTASATLISPGGSVTFTDKSQPGGTDYAWDFGDGSPVASGLQTTRSHTYSAAGVYTVSLTVTYDPEGPLTVVKAGYVRVETGLCTVPDLGGKRFNDAAAIFQGAPYKFTGAVLRDVGAPAGNFVITAQDLTATSLAPCASDIKVTQP